MLASIVDVEARLGRDISEDEVLRVDGLLEEASVLVESHLGREFEVVQAAFRLVVSRMVARVLESPDDGFNSESASFTAGPFSKNVKYVAGASGGSPWLTTQDKTVLNRFRKRRGFYSVPMV